MKRMGALCLLLVTALAARTDIAAQSDREPLLFVAELAGRHVAPEAVQTGATGKATGLLIGSRFIVHGSFSGLSSELRDIQKLPEDPGIHLHRGAAGEVTKYFHGLRVKLNADERSGIFHGETMLDEEQRKLLLQSRVYIDVHTVEHGPGEIRDQWRAADPGRAAELLASLTAGRDVTVPLESSACHK